LVCARAQQFALVLMDIHLRGEMDGIQAIQEIKNENPEAHILVLTSFAEDDKLFPAIKAGAIGYLLKDTLPNELLMAIRAVYKGESYLHPTIALKVLKELQPRPQKETGDIALTERETEVLKLIAQGHSNQEIADKLVLSERTVHSHVNHILAKLQLASRTQAALYALRKGIASLGQE
jgi:NarL family two-component system response regulator LiaR